jgi:hypothetical protein
MIIFEFNHIIPIIRINVNNYLFSDGKIVRTKQQIKIDFSAGGMQRKYIVYDPFQ